MTYVMAITLLNHVIYVLTIIFIHIFLLNCIPIFIDENGYQEYDDTIAAAETGMQQLSFLCL